MNNKETELVEIITAIAKAIAREPEKVSVESETLGRTVRIAIRPGRPGDVPILIGTKARTFRALQSLARILGDRMELNVQLHRIIEPENADAEDEFVQMPDRQAWADDPSHVRLLIRILEASGTSFSEWEEFEGKIPGADISKTFRFKQVAGPRGAARTSQRDLQEAIREAFESMGRTNGVDMAIEFGEER